MSTPASAARPAPWLPPFPVQVAAAVAASAVFILWVGRQWGGEEATTRFSDLASIAVPAGAAWACLVRARLGNPGLRTAWRLVGAACLAWALGQTAWTVTEFSTGQPPATPSLADAGYLLLIPFAAWGVARFVRPGQPTGYVRPLLDGAIVGSSFVFIAFAFGLEGIVLRSTQGDLALTVNLLYPFGDAAILGVVLLRLSRAPPEARGALGLLAAGFILLAVADLWFLVADAQGAYNTGGILDAFWVMGFQCIGLAAMRPGNLVSALPPPRQTPGLALLPLYPFAFAAVAACVAEVRDGGLSDTLFWTALVVVLLVFARLMVMLLENVRLTAREAAAVQALREEKAVRARMLNAITHDMLNAMSPIRLQVRMLASGAHGPASAPQLEAVAMVSRNAERMARLAGDLKDGASLEEGRLALLPVAMDLAALVRDAVTARQAEAAERRVVLSFDVPPAASVRGDAERLTQVVDNLLSNALKFTPGGGKVSVRVRADGPRMEVRVADTGRGLEPAEQARLFQPFSQVHGPGEVKEHGTGLGLFISKGIVERHGGRIWVESPGRGQGTTFVVALPVQGDDPPALSSPAVHSSPAPA